MVSDLNFGKMGFQTSVFPFHPQFFPVKCYGREEQFRPDVLLSPGKKTAESKICFEQCKSSHYLDSTAHAQIDSSLGGNIFLCFVIGLVVLLQPLQEWDKSAEACSVRKHFDSSYVFAVYCDLDIIRQPVLL